MKPLAIGVILVFFAVSFGIGIFLYQQPSFPPTAPNETTSIFLATNTQGLITVITATTTPFVVVNPSVPNAELTKKTIPSALPKSPTIIIGVDALQKDVAGSYANQGVQYTEAYNNVIIAYNGLVDAVNILRQTVLQIGNGYTEQGFNAAAAELLPTGISQGEVVKQNNNQFVSALNRWNQINNTIPNTNLRTAGRVLATAGEVFVRANTAYGDVVAVFFAYTGGSDSFTQIMTDAQSAVSASVSANSAFAKAVADFNALLQ